jgi:hypothetical protein
MGRTHAPGRGNHAAILASRSGMDHRSAVPWPLTWAIRCQATAAYNAAGCSPVPQHRPGQRHTGRTLASTRPRSRSRVYMADRAVPGQRIDRDKQKFARTGRPADRDEQGRLPASLLGHSSQPASSRRTRKVGVTRERVSPRCRMLKMLPPPVPPQSHHT